QDGTVGVVGQFDEGGQAGIQASDGAGGVDDEQAHLQLADGSAQVVQVARKVEGAEADGGLRSLLDSRTVEDEAGGVATGGLEAGFDGVVGGLVGGDEQDV